MTVTESKYEYKKDWYFTFGIGHEHEHCYVIFNGTYDEAREKMFAKFGSKWCRQCDDAEEAGVKRHELKEIKCP